MTTTAYVLVETAVGKTKDVARSLRASAGIKRVDVVTGPYDLVVQVEGDSVNAVGELVTGKIHSVPGIDRTVTLIAVQI
jgi:DNA-binding Lrp family transcriptional regulator